jgi:putative membrane protein
MQTFAYALAIVAGFVHVSFFYFESIAWKRPSAHRLFGIRTPEEAEAVATPMFHLGFYNLFSVWVPSQVC